jgi:hypothetical protein
MIWLYERDDEAMHVETRVDTQTGEYVGTLIWPDGRRETQRSADGSAFSAWLRGLADYLQRCRWSLAGPPALRQTIGRAGPRAECDDAASRYEVASR